MKNTAGQLASLTVKYPNLFLRLPYKVGTFRVGILEPGVGISHWIYHLRKFSCRLFKISWNNKLPKVLDVIVDSKVEVQFERQTGARSNSMRINIKQGPMIRRQIYLSYIFWVHIAFFLAGTMNIFQIPCSEEEMIELVSHLNSKLVMAPWQDSIRRSKTSTTIKMILTIKNIVLRQIFNWFQEASQVTCMQKLLHFNNLQQQDFPCIPIYFSRMVVFLDTFGGTHTSSLINTLKKFTGKKSIWDRYDFHSLSKVSWFSINNMIYSRKAKIGHLASKLVFVSFIAHLNDCSILKPQTETVLVELSQFCQLKVDTMCGLTGFIHIINQIALCTKHIIQCIFTYYSCNTK